MAAVHSRDIHVLLAFKIAPRQQSELTVQEQVQKSSKQSEPVHKLKVEKDVDIPMRDGAKLKADVFRPDGDGQFPVLINMGINQ